MKKLFAFLSVLLLTVLVSACSMFPMNDPTDTIAQNNSKKTVYELVDYTQITNIREGYVLAKAEPGVDLEGLLAKFGSSIEKEWPAIGWTLVTVPAGETAVSFVEKLNQMKEIVLAEPELEYQLPYSKVDLAAAALQTSSDATSYNKQWAFANINAEAAWEITTGSSEVIVAIVDTGVQEDHPEFADKVFIGRYDASIGAELPLMYDLDGHGTHVAGIAADDGRSGEVAGVAWDCPILPVKVMDDAGSIYTSYLTDAMIYLGDYAESTDQRIVANMSIGGRGYDFAFKDAIDYAAERGVLLVTSAGNDTKRIPSYPSAYNGVVSVAASTPRDEKADFSTEGWWNSLAAPGVKIYSTYLYYPDYGLPGYEYLQGTSMASPYVTGAAALLLSQDPDLSPLEVKNRLEQTARDNGRGFTEELGYGILDLEALLREIPPMQYGSLDVQTNIISTVDTGFIGTGVITVFDAASGALVSYGTTGEYGNYIFHALKPGNYTVNVTYYDLYNGEYVVRSGQTTVTANDEATLVFDDLPVPSAVSRELYYEEDVVDLDGYYEIPITITEESLYEFETTEYQKFCDTMLYLFDADGNLLAFNDDHLDRYSYIGIKLPPGNYTVAIEQWHDEENPITGLYAHLNVYKTLFTY